MFMPGNTDEAFLTHVTKIEYYLYENSGIFRGLISNP